MFDESMTVGQLLDNPALKAVVEKHAPGLTSNPMIAMAKGMSISQIKGMIPADMMGNFEKALAEIKTLV